MNLLNHFFCRSDCGGSVCGERFCTFTANFSKIPLLSSAGGHMKSMATWS